MMLLLAAHFLAALLMPLAARRIGPRAFLAAAVVPAATALWALWQAPGIVAGTPVTEVFAGRPRSVSTSSSASTRSRW
jgi:multicomponent Na+:H+ antiporter subunit A